MSIIAPTNISTEIDRGNTTLYCNRWAATVKFYGNRIEFPVLLRTAWFVGLRLIDDVCLIVADAAHASANSTEGAR